MRRSESPADSMDMTLRRERSEHAVERDAKWENSLPNSEEFTGGSSKGDVGSSEEVDGGLGEHRVVLQLGSSEGRQVTGEQEELGLSRSESSQAGLVTEGVLSGLDLRAGEKTERVR